MSPDVEVPTPYQHIRAVPYSRSRKIINHSTFPGLLHAMLQLHYTMRITQKYMLKSAKL
uniref:Uncharacterized protein n=2 Tax=Anguilla anguilla TaxID=7936 RepID=A0A0E9QPQ9_ANGAN